MKALLATIVIGLSVLVFLTATRSSAEIVPLAEIEPPTAVTTSGAPAAKQASVPVTPEPPGELPQDALVFPDGSSAPSLNGVTGQIPLINWPNNVPFSPVVELVPGTVCDWYRHENGMFSTVFMSDVTVDGVTSRRPITKVATPVAKAPRRQPGK